MREIKFRAVIEYDKVQTKEAIKMRDKNTRYTTIYFTLDDLINPSFSIRELLIPWLKRGNRPDLYTCITDKGGREIYERDLVTMTNVLSHLLETDTYIVIWENGTFVLRGINNKYSEYIMSRWAELIKDSCEIIGNAWVNSGLLKEMRE